MFAGVAAIAAAATLVYWPALRAFFEGDDFSLLAFARILRNPFALFVHEHFPLGPYFRPLTMTLWWLTARAFGNAVVPQYALNLFLHVCVSLALWRLLAAFARGAIASWIVALLFALHPIAIGTSLWLADRFDLLATLLSLLALRAAHDARMEFPARSLALTFLLLAGAVLSKEIGIVAAVVVGLVWIWPPDQDRPASAVRWRRRRRSGLLILSGLVLAWLAWRARVISAGPNPFPYADIPLAVLLRHGSARWIEDFSQYLLGWGRLPGAGRLLLVSGAIALLAAAVLGRRERMTEAAPIGAASLPIGCAIAIVLLCIVIAAPFSYLWSVDFSSAPDPTSVAAYSRLFYFPLCGIAIGVAPVAARLPGRSAGVQLAVARALLCTGTVMMALPWAYSAHDLANRFRRQSNEKRPSIVAAVEAVTAATPQSGRCRVFLLGIDGRGSGYVLKTMSDAVIKALVQDVHAVEHCLLQSEQTSWAYTIGGVAMTPTEALPLRPMTADGAPAAWIEVGGVQVAYLNLAADIDARSFPDALFLRQQGGRFQDVTASVRDGSLPVAFVCARSPLQCR